jgi:hypothetical protein
MTSPAIEAWRSCRLPRLDRLLAAHPSTAGSSTDPAVAQELTEALVLRLAAEFQGFCRDLHDDVVKAILVVVAPPTSPVRTLLLNGLTVGRGLGRRSADPKTIAEDFGRLGYDLWGLLGDGRPDSARAWREGLRLLHRMRNGLIHDDRAGISEAEAAGWPLSIDTVWAWRNLLDELASAMQDASELGNTRMVPANPKE